MFGYDIRRGKGGSVIRPTLTRCLLVPVFGLVLAACGGASHPQAARTSELPLGDRPLPTFLPQNTSPVDRVVTATAAHHQLAVQGVEVRVELSSGHVLATVSGPRVPPFVSPPPPTVTATFDITLAQTSGSVPVRPTDFTITDQLGRTYHPSLVTGETAPPSMAPRDRTLRFQVTAVMPTGEGRLHWAPGGGAPLVSWDFIVEND